MRIKVKTFQGESRFDILKDWINFSRKQKVEKISREFRDIGSVSYLTIIYREVKEVKFSNGIIGCLDSAINRQKLKYVIGCDPFNSIDPSIGEFKDRKDKAGDLTVFKFKVKGDKMEKVDTYGLHTAIEMAKTMGMSRGDSEPLIDDKGLEILIKMYGKEVIREAISTKEFLLTGCARDYWDTLKKGTHGLQSE